MDVRAKRNIVRRDKDLLVVFNGSSVARILLVFVLLRAHKGFLFQVPRALFQNPTFRNDCSLIDAPRT